VKVVVIGGGIAGAAAVYVASRHAEVSVVFAGSGATEFALGVLSAAPATSDPELLEFASAFDFLVPSSGVLVKNHVGALQKARGAHGALLDFGALCGKRVGVTTLGRHAYGALERSAVDGVLSNLGVSLQVLDTELFADFAAVSDVDFARRFEAPEARAELAQCLRSGPQVDAWLVPPCLGVEELVRSELETAVGVPVGECLPVVGGVFGARFRARRDALFARASAEVLSGHVARVVPSGAGFEVHLEDSAKGRTLRADAVVLAVGGVMAGGVEFGPLPGAGAPPWPYQHFSLGLELPVPLEIGGKPIEAVSTPFGIDLSVAGLDTLERVGVRGDSESRTALAGLFAAGDIVADRPRSLWEAITSGLSAGHACVTQPHVAKL
jgi:hypothetical protein